MPKIRTVEDLREAIRDLEHQNYVNEQHMRQRVTEIADRLKPVNLVKGIFFNLWGSSEVKTNVFRMAAGMVTSLLVKQFFKKKIAK
ncbi:MAG: hypothetical protein J0H74_27000 [Chitinophagaceae bacterium]|nr:hypothetical protein [Chitinophagaceae bacterium]